MFMISDFSSDSHFLSHYEKRTMKVHESAKYMTVRNASIYYQGSKFAQKNFENI